ncbi:hypothetical protein V8E53_001502 [Lactarius tabidus]
MPTKPLKETTGLENHMLFTAAKLLSAVRWVAENPPTLEKMEYLNERVMDEIRFISTKYGPYTDPESKKLKIPRIHPIIQVMTDEWKAASIEQRRPCWHIFTEVNIQYICDQVAVNNPTWFPDLYATNLTLYLNGVHANKLWWLHSVPQSSRVWEDTVHESGDADVAMQEPDIPSTLPVETEAPPHSAPSQSSPVELLTRAAKKAKVRVVEEPAKKTRDQPVAAAAPSTAPVTPPVAGPSKKRGAPRRDSSDSSHDFNDDDTPMKKATEMPPGVAVPSVLVEGASPPQQNRPPPPSTTGDKMCGPCKKGGETVCSARYGRSGQLRTACLFCWIRKISCDDPRPRWAVPIFEAMQGAGRVLDDDTRQQLNRIEAMLTAICNSSGIVPETLPGYDRPTSASPSSQSQSSAGVQMETLHISDTRSNTSSHSSTRSSQPPRKKAARGRGSGDSAGGRTSGHTSSNNSRGSSLGRA